MAEASEISAENTPLPKALSISGRTSMAGMIVSDVKRLKKFEEENLRLKRIFADLSLDYSVLKDVISIKGWGLTSKRN